MLHSPAAPPRDVLLGVLRRRALPPGAAGAARATSCGSRRSTHQAGDAPTCMMDAGVKAVYDAIPIAARGPGVHVMTGSHPRGGRQPPATRSEIRVLSMEPRLAYGTNIAAWWGAISTTTSPRSASRSTGSTRPPGLARAAFAFDYKTTPALRAARHHRAARRRRPPARAGPTSWCRSGAALRRGRRGAARAGPAQQHPARRVRRQRGQLALRAGARRCYYPVFHPGALCYLGDPHMAEGDARAPAPPSRPRPTRSCRSPCERTCV